MEEEKYMRRCNQLAQNGICNTAPIPMVGAVIVCDGKIIGEGYHIRCGEAHAEVNAIRSVKEPSLLKRSTIYVSLEPCAHYGKTPPCADLIIEKQIPRIVIGCQDPFSQVAGRGIQKLRDAGREVIVGVLEKEEDVCCGTSKANSGIVHAGVDARPGSLMAKMNVRGNQMMEQLAEDLDIPFERNGSLVLCFAKDEMERLENL